MRSARSSRWPSRCGSSARRSASSTATPPPAADEGLPGVPQNRGRRPRSTILATPSIIMECGDLSRTGVERARARLRHQHRPPSRQHECTARSTGSTRAPRRAARWCSTWFASSASPLTLEIATHVYIAILTDTGSFHYSNISPRTFDICRAVRRGRRRSARDRARDLRQQQPRTTQAVRRRAERDAARRQRPHRHRLCRSRSWRRTAAAPTRTPRGLINLPLTVKEIQAVVFFKEDGPGDWRVSMRSKGEVDVNAIAKEFGGGGHKNASGLQCDRRRSRTSSSCSRVSCSGKSKPVSVVDHSDATLRSFADQPRQPAHMDGVIVIDKPRRPDVS